MKESPPDSLSPAAPAPPPAKRPGVVTRTLAGFYTWRAAIKEHPLWGTCFAAGIFLIGIAGSILIADAKRWYFGPDKFLVQIAESQKEEFAELKKSLDGLRGSITSDDRQAFRAVESAVRSLESGNAKLVEQLALAKRENDTMRQAAQNAGRVSGGYDFLLSEHSGMRLDEQNVLGLGKVYSNFATVNLSSASAPALEEDLRSGQSVSYRNAKGQSCRVSLLALDDSGDGTASFAVGCT